MQAKKYQLLIHSSIIEIYFTFCGVKFVSK